MSVGDGSFDMSFRAAAQAALNVASSSHSGGASDFYSYQNAGYTPYGGGGSQSKQTSDFSGASYAGGYVYESDAAAAFTTAAANATNSASPAASAFEKNNSNNNYTDYTAFLRK